MGGGGKTPLASFNGRREVEMPSTSSREEQRVRQKIITGMNKKKPLLADLKNRRETQHKLLEENIYGDLNKRNT